MVMLFTKHAATVAWALPAVDGGQSAETPGVSARTVQLSGVLVICCHLLQDASSSLPLTVGVGRQGLSLVAGSSAMASCCRRETATLDSNSILLLLPQMP